MKEKEKEEEEKQKWISAYVNGIETRSKKKYKREYKLTDSKWVERFTFGSVLCIWAIQCKISFVIEKSV